jgi:hypothetical protein
MKMLEKLQGIVLTYKSAQDFVLNELVWWVLWLYIPVSVHLIYNLIWNLNTDFEMVFSFSFSISWIYFCKMTT